MSSTIYNHRSLQPTGPPASGPGQHSHVRLNDSFDTIRQEFDGLATDLNLLRGQRDEYESKITSQVNELNIIRQSLYELEVQHSKIRGQYEDELNRLRNELVTVRQTVPSNAPQPPPLGPGGIGPPGTSGPPVAPGLPPNSVSFNDSYYGRDRERDRERERGEPRERERERLIDREREREMRDRDRERDKDRDRDRSIDHRDAKRLKMDGRDRERSVLERGGGGDRDGRDRERDRLDRDNRMKVDRQDHNSPSIGPGTGTTKLPPPPVVPSASTPGPLGPGFPPGPNANGPYQTTNSLPPVNDPASVGSLVPLNGFPDDPDAVPEHLKKHGSDWFALWNPKAKRVLDVSLVHTLSHESVVCCVRFSADGKYLATGCNRSAQIYDTKTGAKTTILIDKAASKNGDLYIRSVCFSPDGKFLATGAEDKKIRIWDIKAGTIRRIFDGHQQEIYSLDFSQDGRLIVSGSGDKTARIWNMDDGSSKVLTINDIDGLNTDAGVTSVAISPNGQLVAAGSLDTVVRIWDVATGVLVERLRGHRDSVYSVAFTPDGKGLVSGSLDKTLKYWDVGSIGSGSIKGRKEGSNGSSNVPGGSSVNGKKDGETSSQCTMDFMGHKDYVLSVAVSHDGAWVVSGSKDRGVQFWDSRNAIVQCMLQGHKNSVISIDLSPVGNQLATGSGDWQARIWGYTTI